MWWALLSPQGKIQAEGLSGWAEEAFWLDVDQSVADAFLKKMKLYRLRAKVEIDDLRATHSVGWSFDGWTGGIGHADPRGLGERVIAPNEQTADWLPEDEEFDRRRIAAGIPEQGRDFGIDENFAHDIGLDILDGIDFVKGCYIGQEVVSAHEAPRHGAAPAGDRFGHRGAGRHAGGSGRARRRPDRRSRRRARRCDHPSGSGDGPSRRHGGGKSVTLELPAYATYQFGRSSPDE